MLFVFGRYKRNRYPKFQDWESSEQKVASKCRNLQNVSIQSRIACGFVVCDMCDFSRFCDTFFRKKIKYGVTKTFIYVTTVQSVSLWHLKMSQNVTLFQFLEQKYFYLIFLDFAWNCSQVARRRALRISGHFFVLLRWTTTTLALPGSWKHPRIVGGNKVERPSTKAFPQWTLETGGRMLYKSKQNTGTGTVLNILFSLIFRDCVLRKGYYVTISRRSDESEITEQLCCLKSKPTSNTQRRSSWFFEQASWTLRVKSRKR